MKHNDLPNVNNPTNTNHNKCGVCRSIIKQKFFNTICMKHLTILALSMMLFSCYRKQFKACTSERIALQAKAQAAIDQHLKVDKSTGNLRRTNAELDIKNLQDKKRNDSLKIVINSIKRP